MAGEHPHAGIGQVAREHHILRPPDGLHGEGAEAAAGIARRDRLVWHEQHAPRSVRHGRQAGPIHLGADADTRKGDAFRSERREQVLEFGLIDAARARAIPHVDDRSRSGRSLEEIGRLADGIREIGRSKGCPGVERLDRRGRLCSRRGGKAIAELLAGDVDGGDAEAVVRACLFEESRDGCTGALPKVADLAGRRVDQHHDVCRLRLLRVRSSRPPQGDCRHRRHGVIARRGFHEGDRRGLGGGLQRCARHRHEGEGEQERQTGRHDPSWQFSGTGFHAIHNFPPQSIFAAAFRANVVLGGFVGCQGHSFAWQPRLGPSRRTGDTRF